VTAVHHRYATIDGHQLFYREAGSADAPTIVLLHGFPTSSYMYRRLVPALADRYHVIASDHLGFGLSDAPSVEEFDYTFDALTDLTAGLLAHIGVTRYAIYVQDYGAPIGWRLALRTPEAITAIVSQSGNAYDEGFVTEFWKPIVAWQQAQNAETEPGVQAYLTLDATKWQYIGGEPDETLVNPESWHHDFDLLSRPGNDKVQLKLFVDYGTNSPQYPAVHEYFRSNKPPLLAVWGSGDGIFGPDGARAFARDLPDAEIHLLDGGHFVLESAGDKVAELIHGFLGKHLFA
jgi:pimeloyl-ACP methyl ester carboxylesterase